MFDAADILTCLATVFNGLVIFAADYFDPSLLFAGSIDFTRVMFTLISFISRR